MTRPVNQLAKPPPARPLTLTDDELQFIEDYAALLMPRGMPYSSGCVYGLLLLWQRPTTVDEIAETLGLSRVGAWNAARRLETHGHIQRHGIAGSKKALYSPSKRFGTPMLGQMKMLAQLTQLMRRCATETARGEAVVQMQRRADYYETVRVALEAVISKLDEMHHDDPQ